MTALLDLLFPPRCPFCGALLEKSGPMACPACREALPGLSVPGLGRAGEYPCAVAFFYDGPVRTGVRALKFGRKAWRAEVFGRCIAQAAAEYLAGEFDAVTYVPVSWQRKLSRGFDQAQLLARSAAACWGVPAEPALRKIRHNRAQASLDDPARRAQNVRGVYAVPRPERVALRRFLLIDDVCTTGSTLASAAGALMEAGSAGVVCAALAGGHAPQEAEQSRQTQNFFEKAGQPLAKIGEP